MNTKTMQTYWIGKAPKVCDICKGDLLTPAGAGYEAVFIDGVTIMGPWANMCSSCHFDMGRGLGQGRGQKYELQENGRWLKIAG
jgi:hypothetical protein